MKKSSRNILFDRMVSEWKKESDFKYWVNLSNNQRIELTVQLKSKFEWVYNLGREDLMLDFYEYSKKSIRGVKNSKTKKIRRKV